MTMVWLLNEALLTSCAEAVVEMTFYETCKKTETEVSVFYDVNQMCEIIIS